MAVEWTEARLRKTTWWAEGLCTLHLDAEVASFKAGQFAQLAIERDGKTIKRAYSYASGPGEPPEFFITEVENGQLSPTLCALREGETVLVSQRAKGFFTLDEVPSPPGPDGQPPVLWLISTGTGLAPFISMLRTSEPWERFSRIVVVHGVRMKDQLAYRGELEAHARSRPGRITWVPFVTREECDMGHKCRIPEAFEDGRLEGSAGAVLTPETGQVMLCGNPAMIKQMEQMLGERGLQRNSRRSPGHVTTERYW